MYYARFSDFQSLYFRALEAKLYQEKEDQKSKAAK